MVIFIRTGEFSGQEKMNSEMSPDSSPLGSFSAMKLWRNDGISEKISDWLVN